jgi:hypothetical protein
MSPPTTDEPVVPAMSEPPDVPRVPAPWALRGNAWIVLLRLPPQAEARHAFVSAELQRSLAAPVSALMFVDYLEAPCGPYRELLFIPGVMRFPDGRRHASISRILVSTWDSVVNGRANWGIPKDRGDFDIVRRPEIERLTVSEGERQICRLDFEPARGLRLPLTTSWLPASWLTLAQSYEGRVYYYAPTARGSMKTCRLLKWEFDRASFPDLTPATVVSALRIEDFALEFPVARVASIDNAH